MSSNLGQGLFEKIALAILGISGILFLTLCLLNFSEILLNEYWTFGGKVLLYVVIAVAVIYNSLKNIFEYEAIINSQMAASHAYQDYVIRNIIFFLLPVVLFVYTAFFLFVFICLYGVYKLF